MLKFVGWMFLSFTVFRWCYAEIELVCPGAIPVVNFILDKTEIPTHDTWPKDSVESFYRSLAGISQSLVSAQANTEERNQKFQRNRAGLISSDDLAASQM